MNLYRYESFLLNQNGTPITNAQVWVCVGSITPNFSVTPPGPLATVYSDILGTIPIVQPILTSPLGNYAFCAAPGTYTAVFITTGVQSSDVITIPSVFSQIIAVDGSQYTSVQQALAALPAAGGTIDMRGNSSPAALALGTFDPGTKAVTILLGPFTYTVNQITLRRALQIIGQGGFTANSTTLQATGGNSTPPFVIDQVIAAQSVILKGFALQGTAGNTTQNGINLVNGATGGLWYSEFDNLFITGFGGISLNFDGQHNGSGHQFCTFKRIVILRPINGNYALQLIGFNNSMKFENCEFDGQLNTQDGKTNIFIGQGTGSIAPPYNIKFDLVTCQFSGVGFQINGADCVSVDQGHFEAVQQCFAVGAGAGFGSLNITIHDSGFFNSCGKGTASPGVGVGQGYIIKNQAATPNASIAMIDSHINTQSNAPDVVLAGNIGSIMEFGNIYGYEGTYVYRPVLFPAGLNGFGNGSAGTNVTTTTKGTGTGPTTPQTIVAYEQVSLGGTIFWIPLCQ